MCGTVTRTYSITSDADSACVIAETSPSLAIGDSDSPDMEQVLPRLWAAEVRKKRLGG